ncbi:sulfotransferase [Prosthecochloris sp. N3]|uniref:Sulfotransferase n=1 Tax=Prosthecochloris ethylica TaxID=2743976 RepID=A0ABR9XTQ6_9CHLB|nr:sulfotransferase [Prosthecochloris ethylica]MBF0587305.1 sulfotransferase [Prosthecochloris ethylica]MBF0637441.1 sulfotransferase [Prosthecochloris ethylica]NUK48599.1 sulfotransferase [Prosthecochloris ethylica]
MIVINDGAKVKLPDFFIVGAAKSGTTSLYYYLKNHRDVYMPKIKEPWFFSFVGERPEFVSPDPLPNIVSELNEYISLFEDAKNSQVIGEASPSYLYTYNKSISSIKKVYGDKCKDIKVIIILRNPVDRAFSQYSMFRRDGNEPEKNFEKAFLKSKERVCDRKWNIFYDYMGFGMYSEQVKTYKKEFKDIKIYMYDELVNEKERVLKDICKFLSINYYKDAKKLNHHNVSGVPNNYFSYPIYYLMYRDNPIKKMLKKVLSDDVRVKVRCDVSRKILKKNTLNNNVRERVNNFYREDMKKLEEVIEKKIL